VRVHSRVFFFQVIPTWAIREEIKNICDRAVEKSDLHSLTYNRVKEKLQAKFGNEVFDKDKVRLAIV
jgi:predicted house-cleaning noncanonical NTP pyrophosphatase (MazG superfamily)